MYQKSTFQNMFSTNILTGENNVQYPTLFVYKTMTENIAGWLVAACSLCVDSEECLFPAAPIHEALRHVKIRSAAAEPTGD